jgi:hypothetical protein
MTKHAGHDFPPLIGEGNHKTPITNKAQCGIVAQCALQYRYINSMQLVTHNAISRGGGLHLIIVIIIMLPIN